MSAPDALATDLPDALISVPLPGAAGVERVAVEMPVALSVNGISQAVMLATPHDLEDFALGFALNEAWIGSRHELLDVEARVPSDGIELALTVTAAREQQLKARRRQLGRQRADLPLVVGAGRLGGLVILASAAALFAVGFVAKIWLFGQ